MNTVKRWLAGLLSFAMIFTSAAFTNLSMIPVNAASAGVEVTATNAEGTSYKVTVASLDEALWKAKATGLTEWGEGKITIKLLGDETVGEITKITRPMVIDLNGFKIDGLAFDNLPLDDGLCVAKYDYRADGYPRQIVIGKHNAEYQSVYNWKYDEDHKPDWYVDSVSAICPNCGCETPVDIANYKTIYNADKERYEFRNEKGRVVTSWKPGDADADDWLLSGLPWITKIAGETVKEGGLPVVYVPIRKIDTGEEQNVKATVSAVTDANEIKEIIKYQKGYNVNGDGFVYFSDDRNGIIEGNTPATCTEDGAQIYKLTVNDPNSELVATIYIRDEEATPAIPHEKGMLKGYQVARISKSYDTKDAALRAADIKGRDIIGEPEQRENGKWYYMFWPKKEDGTDYYETIEGTGAGDTTGVINVHPLSIRENGTFDYRFVYDCDYEADTDSDVFGETKTSEVYPDATTNAEAKDGKHSVCEYWVIQPIKDTYTYTKNGKKVTYNHVADVKVGNNPDLSQMLSQMQPPITLNIKQNYIKKIKAYIKHKVDTTQPPEFKEYGTCMDEGEEAGYLRTYKCAICPFDVEERVKVDHQFVTSEEIPLADLTSYPTTKVTGVDGDTRKYTSYTTVNGFVDSITFDSDCTHEGGTYRWCNGVVYPNTDIPGEIKPSFAHGHWAIVPGTEIEPKGHDLVATANTGEWKAWYLNYETYEYEVIEESSVKSKTTNNEWYDGYADGYSFETDQTCSKGCNDAVGHVIYHSWEGTDGYDDEGVYHVYNAITINEQAPGADCRSEGGRVYTVKDLTTDGKTPVTLTYLSGKKGPHNYEVSEVNWSDDYETATITGYCTVDGCVDKTAHPGYPQAIVSRSVDKNTGITTFTATYNGVVVGEKKAYSLNHAEVTFDPTKIEDTNLVTGVLNYCAPVDDKAPAVTVEIDGVVLDNSLFTFDWLYNQSNIRKSGVASTAREVWVDVYWADSILTQKDVAVINPLIAASSKEYNATSNKKFKRIDTTILGLDDNDSMDEDGVYNLTYDKEKSYSVVTTCVPEDATIKYAVLDKEVEGETIVDYQRNIEALDYNLDEVKDIQNVGEYHVYAQISKDGYTTCTREVAEIVINKRDIYADVDNLTVIEGTKPVFGVEFFEYDGKDKVVLSIDPSEYTVRTLGGGALDKLKVGEYKIQISSDNYRVLTEKYGSDYVCVLNVIAMDDATAADQAKAKAVEDQILALSDNPTEAEVAAARAAYDKLPDAAKARISADALKKLTDAEDAIKAVKDADAAIAAAKGYESDSAVANAIKALQDALAKRDTAAIKTATTNLTNAVNQAKKAAEDKAAADNVINQLSKVTDSMSQADAKKIVDAYNALTADQKALVNANATAKANLAKAQSIANKPVTKPTPSVKISTKSKTYKAKDLKKKAKSFKIKYSKTSGSGKATFKKSSGSKKLKVSKAGKITVKKGTKKGTYKIKVKLTVAANSKFNAKTVKKTIKVKVK